MSDDDPWWLFLNHREECSHEFWEELGTRKAAGTLSNDSPFWTMGKLARYPHPRGLSELSRCDPADKKSGALSALQCGLKWLP